MKRILVAEDDPDVSGLVRTLLEAAGHEVRIVEDGSKALSTFEKDDADVVILDVLLPGRNGFQVAEAIRAGDVHADVPIVMLSGVYRGPTYRAQAKKRFGAVEYLEKPIEIDRLLAAVLRALENPRPVLEDPDDEPTEMSAAELGELPPPPVPDLPPPPQAAAPPPPTPPPPENATPGSSGLIEDDSETTTDREPLPGQGQRSPDEVPTTASSSPSEAGPDSMSPTETRPPGAVRSLAASARKVSGRLELGDSLPRVPPQPVRAPRPSDRMDAFDPNQVGHTDRLLAALKSPGPEVTDSHKAAAPPPLPQLEPDEEGAASLPDGLAAPRPAPLEAASSAPTPAREEPADGGAAAYADPDSVREKKLVERSIRTARGTAQGDLRHAPFPVLLNRLYKERVSGALLLVRDPVKKIVYFKDGLPVFVKSNLLSECLGKVLVRERLITDAQCRESLRLLQETKRQQGALLIQMGALSETNLGYGLQLQLRTKLYEIFSWPDGEYRLSTRTKPPMETAMLESTIEEILFEGIRSSFEPERLRRELEPCMDLYLAIARDGDGRLRSMPLQPADRVLVGAINGTRTVREVLARATGGPGSAAQLVYALLCAELVETRTFAASQPPSDQTGPETLTDAEGRPLITAVDADQAVAAARAALPASPLPQQQRGVPARPGSGETGATASEKPKPRPPSREHPSQSTAELMASPDVPILPTPELDKLVEDTLAAELHFQKASAHLAARRWEDAVRALQRANDLCPDQPDFLANLGWALFCARGEAATDDALREIDRALAASPTFDRAFVLRAFIWKAMGRIEDAMRDFEQAVAANPDCAEAHRELDALRPLARDEIRR